MRSIILTLLAIALAAPAAAMERNFQGVGGAHAAVHDPDERLERLAAASTPTDNGHGKPARSARGILRNDPYLQAAFASLDNK